MSAARDLLNKCLVSKIAKSGFPGFELWKQRLNELSVCSNCIQGVSVKDTLTLNTLIEAEALIRFAKSKSYSSIYIVAAPFQQLRAFMTSVTVALREYPIVKLYSEVGIHYHG